MTDSQISDSSEASSLTENLKLSDLQTTEITKEIVFPNELNQYLRDQIQYLTHENARLKKNVSENEFHLQQSKSKIENLSAKLNDYETASTKNGFTNASTLASSKIVELSKKLREKNSEIEVLKTKCSKLQQYISKLEENDNKNAIQEEKPEIPQNELQEQVKELQEKLNATTTKLFETKNLNLQLKNELKMANKLVQQEIGDSFENIQKSLSTNQSSWRGRAQIICELQQKNNELRDKLKCFQDKQNQPKIHTKTEIQNETLLRENNNLKHELESITKKYGTVRIRCKYYESECCSLKAKLSAKTEQNERDSELITTLTAQMAYSKDSENDALKQKQLLIKKLEQENKQLTFDLEKEKCKFNNMQMEIDNKMTEIEELKKKYNEQSPKQSNIANVDDKTINHLEVEKQKLLELTQLCNKRLETERNAHANTQNKYIVERQRAAKLESKLARMQLQSDRSSTYSTMSGPSKVCDNSLEDQLELAKENIKSLQTRLQIEQHERKIDFQEFSKILQNRV